MQIVFLSDRPTVLRETLTHVAHFAPMFDDVVIIAPRRSADAFDGLGTVVTDEDLSGRTTAELGALDHSSRNYLLRAAIVGHDAIDDVFVMSDDDSRPLVAIGPDFFVDADGRHRRRYFHTLADWRYASTDFDQAQLHTWVVLRQLGFADPLCYGSHMPQIIDKALYASVAAELADVASRYSLDEWSPYFTIAPARHPERFAPPEPFVTLAWPQFPGEWPHQVTPPHHAYENFHPELYEDGAMFAGLPRTCDPETIDAANLDKIVRWYRLDRKVRELDFPDDVDQPWTSPNQGRKLAFRGLRAARSAYRYINLDERARIADLEGRMHRLESRTETGPERPADDR